MSERCIGGSWKHRSLLVQWQVSVGCTELQPNPSSQKLSHNFVFCAGWQLPFFSGNGFSSSDVALLKEAGFGAAGTSGAQ